MKGNNTITLNQATMIEAAQVWIDQNFTAPAPKADKVSFNASTGTFEISLLEPSKETFIP